MSVDPVSLAITVALNVAMSASRKIEGPRLKDTSASVADYGTPLNYLVGQRLVTCPCFFAKPIREERKKRKGKGGKQVNYTGYGTWASHVADMPIAGIGQILLDNHLVYDALSGAAKTYPLGPGYDIAAHMRIYLGTEDQEPDPDMLAYIEARDGPGTCPAYRGQSYIYFENIPLEMFGNRFPNVTVLAHRATRNEAKFKGWYARAFIELINPFVPNGPAFYVDPDVGARIFGNDTGVWPGSSNAEFPAGIPYVVYDTPWRATVYWCEPSVMNATEIDLRLQFGNDDTAPDTRARFRFQYWTQLEAPALAPKANSTIISPGTPSWSMGEPFDVRGLWPDNWYFGTAPVSEPEFEIIDAGAETHASLDELLALVATRCGIDPTLCDWDAAAGIDFKGYNWTQGTGRQILEPVLDLMDVDVRPHDFGLQALPRGSAAGGAIATREMVRERQSGVAYQLSDQADSDLPRRIYLVYADASAAHNPGVAMPPGPDPATAGAVREVSIDMQTLALDPNDAQPLAERSLRRLRFGRTKANFSLTRQRLALEPGDVMTPTFDDREWTMRLGKIEIGANGVLSGEWERDDPAIASLSGSSGAISEGIQPDLLPDEVPSLGFVMDLPLLIDAHEQTAPLAYLTAGPGAPGVWTGADFAQSESGDLDSYTEAWEGIAADNGSIIGTVAEALPAALPWVPDMGSVITVTLNFGSLTGATLADLLENPTLNLAAIRSGTGWELVQFMTPTLIGVRQYTLTGLLRGVRGTEWAIGGHLPGDDFVLFDSAKIRTMGASEIGDTDYYIVSPTGHEPDQDEAFPVDYTGASHKPYAPVDGSAEFDGADILFNATRRTRLGGANVNGQDVPLGETAEGWSLDIIDHTTSPPSVKRTIEGGSLPLTYTEADQIEDFGAALNTVSPALSVTGVLYQVAPPLTLRGYPLEIEVNP